MCLQIKCGKRNDPPAWPDCNRRCSGDVYACACRIGVEGWDHSRLVVARGYALRQSGLIRGTTAQHSIARREGFAWLDRCDNVWSPQIRTPFVFLPSAPPLPQLFQGCHTAASIP